MWMGSMKDSKLKVPDFKACSKRRATAVPNSNDFDSAVARR